RRVRRDQVAAHPEKRPIDNGGAAARLPKMDAQPLFRFAAVFAFCEVFGKGLLPRFEDADTETFFLFEKTQHLGALVDANENQHGLERDGGEGVGGHAVDLAGLALNGNDGDAGGEMAEGFAEFGLGERRSWHMASFCRYHTGCAKSETAQPNCQWLAAIHMSGGI